jgi:hypothetical protein
MISILDLVIGMVLLCDVHINPTIGGGYYELKLENVPTKILYVDKEAGDFWLQHSFKGVKGLVKNNYKLKVHAGSGMLNSCQRKKK